MRIWKSQNRGNHIRTNAVEVILSDWRDTAAGKERYRIWGPVEQETSCECECCFMSNVYVLSFE